jgi:hypothetical protein
MPAEEVELGETPNPAPSFVDVAAPIEPVSLVNETTTL